MRTVKKILMFAAILFFPAIIFAQGSGSSDSPSPTPSRIEGGERFESNFNVTRVTTGEIVDLKEGILVVKAKKNKETSIALVKETRFKLGKKTIKTDELNEDLFKMGKRVKITWLQNEKSGIAVKKIATEVRFIEAEEAKEKPKLR